MKRHWSGALLAAGLLCALLAACQYGGGAAPDPAESKEAKEENPAPDTGFRIMEPGEYDSKDTAVIVSVSQENEKITFLNPVVNKNYTLRYDGMTQITDKYGGAMSAAQLGPGDIVDVCFQHIPKKCVSVTLSPLAWESDVRSGFTMNQLRRQLSFNGELYTLAERMVLLSKGEEIGLEDLNERDVLSVKGIDNTIYSILVKQGHGYLRLSGEEYFLDGFIEVGQTMVQRITEDMLLTVPEGTYTVVVRNGRHGGSKEAAIYRDEETVLDVSDLKGEEVKTGNVFFTLTPPEASVYIDGEKIDTSTYVSLEYGIHQMIVKADGYETISQYLKVGQENANLNVEMELESGAADTDGSQKEDGDDGDTGDTPQETPDDGTDIGEPYTEIPGGEVSAEDGVWHVKVNAPAGAEVYVDGNYIGIAPASFPKKEGTHVISLRRSGYQTRSYTIQVDGEEKDMELSFSDLAPKATGSLGTDPASAALGALKTGEAESWANDLISQTLLDW